MSGAPEREVQQKSSPEVEARSGRPPVLASVRSDAAAEEDALGREHYVDAMATLLLDEATQVPLTVGVYGAWGSGKSSFMTQLAARLRGKRGVVHFNPWRFPRADELWAGLIAEVSHELDRRLTLLDAARYLWTGPGVGEVLRKGRDRALGMAKKFHNWFLVFLPLLGIVLPIEQIRTAVDAPLALPEWLGLGESLPRGTTALFAVVGVVMAIKGVHTLARPFTTQFDAYLAGYRTDASRLRRITHVDLAAISRILGSERQKQPIVVFLDDLDRCPPDRIVDVLEAVNLFFDGLPFVTILGVDPRVVAKAVAERYEFLLKSGATDEDKEAEGRFFLEKIIQIPFQLPPVGDFSAYLSSLVRQASKREAKLQRVAFGAEARKHIPWWRIDVLFRSHMLDYVSEQQAKEEPTREGRLRIAVYNRVQHGLPLTEEQQDMFESLDAGERAKLEENRGSARRSAFAMSGGAAALRDLERLGRRKRLEEAVRLEAEDEKILLRYADDLYGNPRSVKRFFNCYRLARLMARSCRAKCDMRELGAWLVLLQNWPIDGARFYREQQRASGAPPIPTMAKFVEEHGASLAVVMNDPIATEIAGCFSFVSLER